KEIIARMPDANAGTINISQPQRAGVEPVLVMEQQVVGLPRLLVYAVHIGRTQRMRLVNREVLRLAVDLAGAGMNDGHLRSVGATQFKELQLRGAVDREIMVGRIHRVEVAGLRREIEQEELPGQKMPHRCAS